MESPERARLGAYLAPDEFQTDVRIYAGELCPALDDQAFLELSLALFHSPLASIAHYPSSPGKLIWNVNLYRNRVYVISRWHK